MTNTSTGVACWFSQNLPAAWKCSQYSVSGRAVSKALHLACYNFSQIMLFFLLSSPICSASAVPGEKQQLEKLRFFHLKAVWCFANKRTRNTWKYLLDTVKLPFIRKTIDCMNEIKPGREHSMLPYVTMDSSFTESVVMSLSLCQTATDITADLANDSGVVLLWAWNEKSVDNINWKSYYLNNQLSCTLQRKPLSFVSPEHDPNSSELNPINDKIYGVIQQRDSESQVSWTPAKHWYRIWMKRLDFRVYMFCQVVQKHSLCELW